MRVEISFGVIPIHETPTGRRYLLVQHKGGHWGFPKGKQEAGETPLATATRELREETGIADARILTEPAFSESYHYTKRKSRQTVAKTVTYFMGFVECEDVTVMPGELLDHAWSDLAGTAAKLSYPEARGILHAAEAHLSAPG